MLMPLQPSPAVQTLLQIKEVPVLSLAERAKDHLFREKLKLLQAEARIAYESAIEEFAEKLANGQPELAAQQGAVRGAALARHSRRAGADAKQRVAYATLLMTAAILNRNNPTWNAADASSDRPDFSDDIVMLMDMNLED
ncbi:MAG: hypothetical protein H7315_13385 [Herminiimonas sp.]|nr:hypothetical protein [Herminiimonas sp.]